MSVSFLNRENAPALAYMVEEGCNRLLPPVLFLTGFRSDMLGTKAAFLSDYCAARGQAFIRFDYRGHGQSGGRFEDGTIGLWTADALEVFDRFCDRPAIVVGSSMGGWIAMLVALARPEKIHGLIGLAAAPDFTRDIPPRMTEEQKHLMDSKGFFPLPSDYADEPYKITRALLEDGENHCLLDGPIAINAPVRLIQGMRDTDVSWPTAQRIADALTTSDKKVILREDGDHRLSSPEDLALLGQMVVELSEG